MEKKSQWKKVKLDLKDYKLKIKLRYPFLRAT